MLQVTTIKYDRVKLIHALRCQLYDILTAMKTVQQHYDKGKHYVQKFSSAEQELRIKINESYVGKRPIHCTFYRGHRNERCNRI